MCGSNLDPDLNKSTIKNILEIRGKIKHGKPDAVKELILLYVIIQTLLNIKKKSLLVKRNILKQNTSKIIWCLEFTLQKSSPRII